MRQALRHALAGVIGICLAGSSALPALARTSDFDLIALGHTVSVQIVDTADEHGFVTSYPIYSFKIDARPSGFFPKELRKVMADEGGIVRFIGAQPVKTERADIQPIEASANYYCPPLDETSGTYFVMLKRTKRAFRHALAPYYLVSCGRTDRAGSYGFVTD